AAGGGGCGLGFAQAAFVGRVVGEQHFLGGAGGGNEAGFVQFGEGVGEFFGGGVFVAVDGALHASGVFGLLQRGRGLHHPRALAALVFVLVGLAFLGAARHVGAARRVEVLFSLLKDCVFLLEQGLGAGRVQVTGPGIVKQGAALGQFVLGEVGR